MTAIERENLLKGTREGAPHTSKRIQECALQLFYERGYKSTTMREIALACGLTPGALYNHFSSKEELLGTMLVDIHRRLELLLTEALETAGDDPRDQVRSYCRAHALFHTQYITEARVANREIGSLTEDALAEVVRIRRQATEQLRGVLERGRDEGVFDVPNVNAVANLILTMDVSIASWYRPDGELSREEMADLDAEVALRMVKGGDQ